MGRSVVDITGQRFGKLVAINPVRIDSKLLWLCICDCGANCRYTAGKLRAGDRKSCGGSVHTDLTAKIFGRLTVVGKDTTTRSKRQKWICICECGAYTSVVSYSLTGNKTVSCGCFMREASSKRAVLRNHSPFNRLKYGEASFNVLILSYKTKAAERSHIWGLTDDQARKLFSSNCYYCGVAPYQVCRSNRSNGGFVYNGLDRLDNSRGYTPENVVSCCGPCNVAKRAMSESDFLKLVSNIYRNRVTPQWADMKAASFVGAC